MSIFDFKSAFNHQSSPISILKMKKLIFLFCLIQYGPLIFAQDGKIDNATMNSFSKLDNIKSLLSTKARNVTPFDNRYEGVKGSPFIHTDWLEGRLILADSTLVKNRMLYKFDAMKNEIWVQSLTGQEHILYNRDVISLDLIQKDGKKIKFRKFKMPQSQDRHHFTIGLFEGKNWFLAKEIKKIFRASNLEDKGIVTVGNAYDWFEDQVTFYLRKEDFEAKKVSLKKNDIVEAAQLSKNNLFLANQFCNEKGLKGKLTEEQAIELVGYLDILKNE
jgi:hypothetical protein